MSASTRIVDAVSGVLDRRIDRRGLLARAAVVASAVAVGGVDYVLRPGSAYASACGEGSNCADGWTVMCCTIHEGVNACPPGSFAGGWWKAEGASLCGGKARYYVDCQAECGKCKCAPGSHFCSERCWSCKAHCADHGGCDRRRDCYNAFRYGQCDRGQHCSGPVRCRVISCTPPWKWADCSKTSATDDFTVSHSAPCLPRWTAIQHRYTKLGSQASLLGTTVHGEISAHRGRIQRYQHGRMYWSPPTGAHFLTGAILDTYLHLGQTTSHLGLPISDSHQLADHSVRAAWFRDGGIIEREGHSAYGVWGPIWTLWKANGLYDGELGFPTSNLDSADGDSYVHFENGSIYLLRDGSTVLLDGVIGSKYADVGYEASPLGVPTSGIQTATDGGSFANFEGGVIYCGPGLEPQELYGAIALRYKSLNDQVGPLGYPTSDIDSVPTGAGDADQASFQNGVIIGTPAGGYFGIWGPIYTRWSSDGGPTSTLGLPTSDVFDLDSTHQRCNFVSGYAVCNEATGKVTITLT